MTTDDIVLMLMVSIPCISTSSRSFQTCFRGPSLRASSSALRSVDCSALPCTIFALSLLISTTWLMIILMAVVAAWYVILQQMLVRLGLAYVRGLIYFSCLQG